VVTATGILALCGVSLSFPQSKRASDQSVAVGWQWLFVGPERAGRRAAVIQPLLGTVKLNGLAPAVWLKEMLEKLPAWSNSRIDELFPLTLKLAVDST
jgi:hypothetical protein